MVTRERQERQGKRAAKETKEKPDLQDLLEFKGLWANTDHWVQMASQVVEGSRA